MATRDDMERDCYVVICRCYSGDDGISVFYELDAASKCMNEEVEVELQNLKEQGYDAEVLNKINGIEVYVPNSDIYFEWMIELTTIR